MAQDIEASDIAGLVARFSERSATIAVIGLGYAGLPLVNALLSAGFVVVGLDVDEEKILMLQEGRTYVRHLPAEMFAAAITDGQFRPTADFSAIGNAHAVLISVPTPLKNDREPNLQFVTDTARNIAAHLKRGHLIVLESTTYPGTTCGVVKPILETTGMKSGLDFYLAYSPEREDPGNAEFPMASIPKIVGCDGCAAQVLATALYSSFVSTVVPVSNPGIAEAAKLLENIFRSVNIALVNEFKVICMAMDLDPWEVIRAAETKPFGFMPFYPGPGFGGHCIPVDPFYLAWRAKEQGVQARFIELAGETNREMPNYVVGRLVQELERRTGRHLKNARILVIGIAYKRNVDDTRESASFRLMEQLEALGAICDYHDPHVPVLPPTREYPAFAGRRSIPLDGNRVASYDVVLIATDHDCIDYEAIVRDGRMIVDTRNACARRGVFGPNVTKA